MARQIKSLQRKVDKEQGNGYAHREHRSKKGRSPTAFYTEGKRRKERIERMRLREREHDAMIVIRKRFKMK